MKKGYLSYIFTILIWGTTWYGIKLQIGITPEIWSLAGRYTLAGIIMLLITNIIYSKKSPNILCHAHFLLKGIMMYFLAFMLFYYSSEYIPSGLVAFSVSSVLIFNIFNDRVINKVTISIKQVALSSIMLIGLIMISASLFNGDVIDVNFGIISKGVLLALLGSYCFSIGNIISKNNKEKFNADPGQDNGFSMLYAGILFCIMGFFTNTALVIDTSLSYISSFLYLTIVGSVLSFYLYVKIINQFGPANAGYVLVYAPVIALILSMLLENVQGNFLIYFGMTIVVTANYYGIKIQKEN
ncbi:DMT family transporter [Marinomonas sp. 2405UD68-3]|uniref:DMT family transporter n=1 Tax=Marinomonas sp. 2405UD68-3 TaxID=3391835 RepID=UPI0039C92B6B